MNIGKCHCGNVEISLARLPTSLTSCNCSICNRLGALWGYYKPGEVTVKLENDTTVEYKWGDEYIIFHHCPICGCATHYTTTEKLKNEHNEERVGINFRIFSLEEIKEIKVKRFDGAKTWKYLID